MPIMIDIGSYILKVNIRCILYFGFSGEMDVDNKIIITRIAVTARKNNRSQTNYIYTISYRNNVANWFFFVNVSIQKYYLFEHESYLENSKTWIHGFLYLCASIEVAC